MQYLRFFCAGDIGGMEPLLASDLEFSGTLFQFHSRQEYLDSLRKDPPETGECKVLSVTEGENSVAVFYDYFKPDQVIRIAQLFRIKNQKIHEMLLIFDSRGHS